MSLANNANKGLTRTNTHLLGLYTSVIRKKEKPTKRSVFLEYTVSGYCLLLQAVANFTEQHDVFWG